MPTSTHSWFRLIRLTRMRGQSLQYRNKLQLQLLLAAAAFLSGVAAALQDQLQWSLQLRLSLILAFWALMLYAFLQLFRELPPPVLPPPVLPDLPDLPDLSDLLDLPDLSDLPLEELPVLPLFLLDELLAEDLLLPLAA